MKVKGFKLPLKSRGGANRPYGTKWKGGCYRKKVAPSLLEREVNAI